MSCPGHRHPALARPIPREQLFWELRELWRKGRLQGPLPAAIFTEALARIHDRNPRRYAEVDVYTRVFVFAPQVLLLPAPYRLGLLAHEVGHVLAGPRASEAEADKTAALRLGVLVEYDQRWPGRGLQRGRRGRGACSRARGEA